jgi:hypothetical protein
LNIKILVTRFWIFKENNPNSQTQSDPPLDPNNTTEKPVNIESDNTQFSENHNRIQNFEMFNYSSKQIKFYSFSQKYSISIVDIGKTVPSIFVSKWLINFPRIAIETIF